MAELRLWVLDRPQWYHSVTLLLFLSSKLYFILFLFVYKERLATAKWKQGPRPREWGGRRRKKEKAVAAASSSSDRRSTGGGNSDVPGDGGRTHGLCERVCMKKLKTEHRNSEECRMKIWAWNLSQGGESAVGLTPCLFSGGEFIQLRRLPCLPWSSSSSRARTARACSSSEGRPRWSVLWFCFGFVLFCFVCLFIVLFGLQRLDLLLLEDWVCDVCDGVGERDGVLFTVCLFVVYCLFQTCLTARGCFVAVCSLSLGVGAVIWVCLWLLLFFSRRLRAWLFVLSFIDCLMSRRRVSWV